MLNIAKATGLVLASRRKGDTDLWKGCRHADILSEGPSYSDNTKITSMHCKFMYQLPSGYQNLSQCPCAWQTHIRLVISFIAFRTLPSRLCCHL